jgi:CheY-like chemotaxis protein
VLLAQGGLEVVAEPSFQGLRSCLFRLAGTLRFCAHARAQGGLEVVAEVRRRWPNTRVRIVAVTADAFEDTREQCFAGGFDGWCARTCATLPSLAALEPPFWPRLLIPCGPTESNLHPPASSPGLQRLASLQLAATRRSRSPFCRHC